LAEYVVVGFPIAPMFLRTFVGKFPRNRLLFPRHHAAEEF